MQFGNVRIDVLREDRRSPRLGMRPLRSGQGAAAVVVAASESADGRLRRIHQRRIVAMVRHAKTAGTRWRSGGRQRERNEGSDEREQEQKSGGQALHADCVNPNPNVGKA